MSGAQGRHASAGPGHAKPRNESATGGRHSRREGLRPPNLSPLPHCLGDLTLPRPLGIIRSVGSIKRDRDKIISKAVEQGFTVKETKEWFLVWGPDDERGTKPCAIGHTPSSQRSLANFLACLKRKGYKQ